jgi:hypothetical protein
LQSGQQPIDGAKAVLADPLLDKMVGHWTMNGKLMGQPTTHRRGQMDSQSPVPGNSRVGTSRSQDCQAAIRSDAHDGL